MSNQSLQGRIVRTLSPTGDWTYGNNLSGYLQANNAIAQQIQCRLLQFLSECFFDVQAGIDWFGWLGSKNPQGLNLAIQTVILNTIGVLSINGTTGFTLDTVTREFTVQWNVTTTFTQNNPGSATFSLGG